MVVLVYNKSASRQRRGSGFSEASPRDAETPSTPAAGLGADEMLHMTAPLCYEEDLDPRHLSDHVSSSSAAAVVDVSEGLPTVGKSAANTAVDTAKRLNANTGEVSAEERKLLKDAELGAVQQIACRDTMLNLKEAFEGALGHAAQMEALRQQDRDRLAELQARHEADQKRLAELLEELEDGSKLGEKMNEARRKIAELQADIEERIKREESDKIKTWTNRLLNCRGTFNSVMMLAQRAHPLGVLCTAQSSSPRPSSTGPVPQGNSSGAEALQETPDLAHFYDASGSGLQDAASSSDTPASHTQPHSTTGSKSARSVDNAAGPSKKELHQEKIMGSKDQSSPSKGQQLSGASHLPASECISPKREEKMSVCLQALSSRSSQLVEAGQHTVGDSLTLRWVLKLWYHRIRSKDFTRSIDVGVDCDICSPAPSIVAKLVDRGSQTDEDIDAERQALQDQILDLKHDLKDEETARLHAAQERDTLATQLAEVMQRHSAEKDHLVNEVLKTQRESQLKMAQKDAEMKELQQKIDSQRDAMQRAEAAWENEKRGLKATIREITSDLQQALMVARRMELMLEKSKKDGGLRDRLAQLIADLQAAKIKCATACKERDQAEERSETLQHKLANTKRKMDLERQFLPLIHLARGPVGEPKALSKTSNSKSEPKLPHRGQPDMLQ